MSLYVRMLQPSNLKRHAHLRTHDSPTDTAPNGTSPAAKSGAEKSPDGTNSAPAENAEGRMAERLQAVETLHSLGRSGDGADGQGERLSKTAEFFLETGFFAPVDEGAFGVSVGVLRLARPSILVDAF